MFTFEQLTSADVLKQYAARATAILRADWGKTDKESRERVAAAFTELLAEYAEGTLAVDESVTSLVKHAGKAVRQNRVVHLVVIGEHKQIPFGEVFGGSRRHAGDVLRHVNFDHGMNAYVERENGMPLPIIDRLYYEHHFGPEVLTQEEPALELIIGTYVSLLRMKQRSFMAVMEHWAESDRSCHNAGRALADELDANHWHKRPRRLYGGAW